MKKLLFFLLILMTACAPLAEDAPPAPTTLEPVSVPESVSTAETASDAGDSPLIPDDTNIDVLANLPEPVCDTGLTPENMEGPYFTPGSPETAILYQEGMDGVKLILAGFVVNEDCLPIPNVKIDFWQADANGNYDNEGYTLRGHQFSDNKGRYYLETVFPGEYASRPIEHIHVKVTSPGGQTLTTQLYFPAQPIENLTVQLEDRGDHYLAFFNFVMR